MDTLNRGIFSRTEDDSMLGIVFALMSMILAAINDFVFKKYTTCEQSKGLFFALIGVVWFFTLLATCSAVGEIDWSATLMWGIISGGFSAVANLLLIEGMSRQSAGLCALIYRLNLVPVVLGAALILHEKLHPIQYFGILLALVAVIFFQSGNRGASANKVYLGVGVVLVIIAAILRAAMGLSYRYGFLHGADKNLVPLINSLIWIVGGVIYAVFRERRQFKVDRRMLGYSFISGMLACGIILTMAYSLFWGEASIVLPIAQMSFIGTFILDIIFMKARCNIHHCVAMLCGVIGIIGLSL